MKAVITSIGSTGDIQPLLALAIEMRRSGHEIKLAFSATFRPLVERYGFDLATIGPTLTPELLNKIQRPQLRMSNLSDQARHFVECVAPFVPTMFEELLALCRHSDVLIGVPFQPACRMVHDATGIPYVSVNMSHFGTIGSRALQASTAPILNRCRVSCGLAPQADPLTADAQSPQLVIYAVSRMLARRSPEWPAHHHVAGFFFVNDELWEPDDQLESFLQQGPPPILVTLGSAYCESPERITAIFVDAAQQANARLLIQTGWGNLGINVNHPNVQVLGFAPHCALMPRTSCVVHHGGAGTTAAALQAGKPQVLIPHDGDQVIWAELARSLGCAGPPLAYLGLTADLLAASIQNTLESPSHIACAKRAAQFVAKECGTRLACELIERVLGAVRQETA
jgi:UDP:flavonoid glycosyltransferase YjiC (YdhE family)